MPLAGRGEPLEGSTGSYRWTKDEYGSLHILMVEHPYLSNVELERLWHQRFEEHKKQGRNYNAGKPKETWRYRHYDGRPLMWVEIARPNQKPDVGNANKHDEEERTWFDGLRQGWQTAANALTPAITLQTPTAQVDSGHMCGCNVCQGKVVPKATKPANTDDSEAKEVKPRGISAKKGDTSKSTSQSTRAPTTKQQKGEDSSSGTPNVSGGKQSRQRRNRKGKQPVYAELEEEEEEEAASENQNQDVYMDADGDDVDYEDAAAQLNFINEGNADGTRHIAHADESFTTALMGGATTSSGPQILALAGRSAHANDSGKSRTGTRTAASQGEAAGSQSKAMSGSGTPVGRRIAGTNGSNGGSSLAGRNGSNAGDVVTAKDPTVKLADVELARNSLRMVHRRNLVVEDGEFHLQDRFTIVNQETDVYKHGGQVMMLAPSGQQKGPFMVCDTNKCTGCKKSADKNLHSPTEGTPYVHLGECIRDLDSGRLLFTPEDTAQYVPASSDQRLDLDNVVLIRPGYGPRMYRVSVCDITTCTYCS